MFGACSRRAIETESVPATYHIPAALTPVIEKLTDHGVSMTRVTSAASLPGQRFRIDSTTTAQREFQQHNERTIFGAYEDATVMVEAGDVLIDMDQALARLVFTLLEPRAADGLANWNVLDRALQNAEYYPINRLVGNR
jgi:hypothetical protein